MGPGELVLVACSCCDSPFPFPLAILTRMRMPNTVCIRCFDAHDRLMLRKWYQFGLLYRQVQALEGKLRGFSSPTA